MLVDLAQGPAIRNKAGTATRIIIIGAGMSGLLTAIKLREAGFDRVEIFEKASRLGGTWRDNSYPGLTCDVPSHVYVYSFELNPAWSHLFSTGAEILDYFERAAEKYRVASLIRYSKEVESANWNGSAWDLRLADGTTSQAEVVITAVGRLHHPSLPDIAGRETFEGAMFHSAQWNHDAAIDGKRVGVIGTGSTATQITVACASRAATFRLFQRTPQWVFPLANFAFEDRTKRLLRRVPLLNRLFYRLLLWRSTRLATSITQSKDKRRWLDDKCHSHLATVQDPELKARLTPDYEPACKRIVISDRFYTEVQRPNVGLVTEAIERIEPKGVRTKDGVLHELDVLILATGFKVDAFMRPMRMTGDDGISLDRLWSERLINYRSVALPHMPNFFMINGPYSPGGSVPITKIAELQVQYVLQCIERIAQQSVSMRPSEQVSLDLLDDIRTRAKATVWGTGGCKSWYLDKHGVPIVNPQSIKELEHDMRKPNWSDYVIRPI